jgi:hypothetical protein
MQVIKGKYEKRPTSTIRDTRYELYAMYVDQFVMNSKVYYIGSSVVRSPLKDPLRVLWSRLHMTAPDSRTKPSKV